MTQYIIPFCLGVTSYAVCHICYTYICWQINSIKRQQKRRSVNAGKIPLAALKSRPSYAVGYPGFPGWKSQKKNTP